MVGVAVVATTCAGSLTRASTTPSATAAPSGGIHTIKHVVVIMQENRSFDSYFGDGTSPIVRREARSSPSPGAGRGVPRQSRAGCRCPPPSDDRTSPGYAGRRRGGSPDDHPPRQSSAPRVPSACGEQFAAEDGRFYSHHGVDTLGVLRAQWGRLTGTDAGGSTLDQQLSHAIYEPGASGVWTRVDEVAISLKLEGHYTKQAILDLYLNAAYFGHGYYGIGAASRGTLGSPPRCSAGARRRCWPGCSRRRASSIPPRTCRPRLHGARTCSSGWSPGAP